MLAAVKSKETTPGNEASSGDGAAAGNQRKCVLCGGFEKFCGGYYGNADDSKAYKCTNKAQESFLVCGRRATGNCTLNHIRIGRRGTKCSDGDIASTAPGGPAYQKQKRDNLARKAPDDK